MLRSSTKAAGMTEGGGRNLEELDKHAQVLYEWLDTERVSRIRMMIQWQGAGGLPYVASTHHRATQCFRYLGNSQHNIAPRQTQITLAEWQQAIQERHRIGHSGMEEAQQSQGVDFEQMA